MPGKMYQFAARYPATPAWPYGKWFPNKRRKEGRNTLR